MPLKDPVEVWSRLSYVDTATAGRCSVLTAIDHRMDDDGPAYTVSLRVSDGYFYDLTPRNLMHHLFDFALVQVERADVRAGKVRPVPARDVPLECRLGVKCLRARRKGDADVEAVFAREKLAGTVTDTDGKQMAVRLLAQMQARGVRDETVNRIGADLGVTPEDAANAIAEVTR